MNVMIELGRRLQAGEIDMDQYSETVEKLEAVRSKPRTASKDWTCQNGKLRCTQWDALNLRGVIAILQHQDTVCEVLRSVAEEEVVEEHYTFKSKANGKTVEKDGTRYVVHGYRMGSTRPVASKRQTEIREYLGSLETV